MNDDNYLNDRSSVKKRRIKIHRYLTRNNDKKVWKIHM